MHFASVVIKNVMETGNGLITGGPIYACVCVCVCVLCEGGREKRGGERVDWLTMKAVLIHTV